MLLLIELPFSTNVFFILTAIYLLSLLAASKRDIFILHMFFKLYIRCFSYLHVILVRLSLVFIKGNLT